MIYISFSDKVCSFFMGSVGCVMLFVGVCIWFEGFHIVSYGGTEKISDECERDFEGRSLLLMR